MHVVPFVPGCRAAAPRHTQGKAGAAAAAAAAAVVVVVVVVVVAAAAAAPGAGLAAGRAEGLAACRPSPPRLHRPFVCCV